MGNAIRRFFIGRNGPDQLSLVLSLLAFALSLIRVDVLFYISIAIFAISIFRMFSKNVVRRRKENLMFLSLVNKPKTWYYKYKTSREQSKHYRVFKCTKCGQKLRVPRGKGKVAIKCSKCGERMIKYT
jgi:DNA-directed RNA polymerase subunit RPC12/RpoP